MTMREPIKPALSIEEMEEEARLDYLSGKTEPLDFDDVSRVTPTSSETSPS
jgi:hypothetical protein